MSDRQLDEVTAVCNRYPDISVTTELPEGPEVAAGETVTLLVNLDREMEGSELAPVHAPRFPGKSTFSDQPKQHPSGVQHCGLSCM